MYNQSLLQFYSHVDIVGSSCLSLSVCHPLSVEATNSDAHAAFDREILKHLPLDLAGRR